MPQTVIQGPAEFLGHGWHSLAVKPIDTAHHHTLADRFMREFAREFPLQLAQKMHGILESQQAIEAATNITNLLGHKQLPGVVSKFMRITPDYVSPQQAEKLIGDFAKFLAQGLSDRIRMMPDDVVGADIMQVADELTTKLAVGYVNSFSEIPHSHTIMYVLEPKDARCGTTVDFNGFEVDLSFN